MDSTSQEQLLVVHLDASGKGRREKIDCSHRVIEKRRRDRINNSLMQLSKLIPMDQLNKKNSGKLEKAEILELTVQYLTQQEQQQGKETVERSCQHSEKDYQDKENNSDGFLQGFKECINNATKFFQEVEELDVSEGRCHRLIEHLKNQILLYGKNDPATLQEFGRNGMNAHANKSLDQVSAEPTSIVKSENAKRSIEELEIRTNKKPRTNAPNSQARSEVQTELEQNPAMLVSSKNESSTSATTQASNLRNIIPFVLPNMPFFPTMFSGANGMPRYQVPQQTQFPGYPFMQPATTYIPVAVPQVPYIGMNFMPGFSVVNPGGDQSNNGVPINEALNAFLPSMYTNGIHANLLATRTNDSGYDSSDKSSLSKESQHSPQSSSDADSCHSCSTSS